MGVLQIETRSEKYCKMIAAPVYPSEAGFLARTDFDPLTMAVKLRQILGPTSFRPRVANLPELRGGLAQMPEF